MVGNQLGDRLDVIGVMHLDTDGEVATKVDHRLQDIERTRPEQFLNIEIPIPTIENQIQGERVFAQMNAVKNLQAETAAELDALLPSILDRAFKGELQTACGLFWLCHDRVNEFDFYGNIICSQD